MTKALFLAPLLVLGLSAASCGDPAPRPAPDAARAAINLDFLCRRWIQSYEEQAPDAAEQTFRPLGFKTFPPSRFRMEYSFSRNGDCEWLFLAPDDAHHFKSGRWSVDPLDETIVRITTEGTTAAYRVSSLTEDLLRIVRIEPEGD